MPKNLTFDIRYDNELAHQYYGDGEKLAKRIRQVYNGKSLTIPDEWDSTSTYPPIHFMQVSAADGTNVGDLKNVQVPQVRSEDVDVVVFSSTDNKRDEAVKLGASEFYATEGLSDYADPGVSKPIDRLIISSSAKFNLGLFYPVLAKNATFLPLSVDWGNLAARTKMQDFAGRHRIACLVEKYPMTLEGVQEAVDSLRDKKMRYRAVLGWEYR
ncbi:hypothetical protein BJY04DRAFT_221277 [Aspergillus karnatakaensis]|uniref:uncharacterized protein n=1 Tax=Aspergillus karnatakaensis TaxID=1810916 RepID=UPI003CCCFAB6